MFCMYLECGWDLAECGRDVSRVARASDSQCRSRNCPGFDPSILRHRGISGAADEAVLNKVHIVHHKKSNKPLYSDTPDRRSIRSWRHCSSRAPPCSSPTTRSKVDLTWVKTSNSRFATLFFLIFRSCLSFFVRKISRIMVHGLIETWWFGHFNLKRFLNIFGPFTIM
jgi:hypothetical protein